jgi:hypothetical protein
MWQAIRESAEVDWLRKDAERRLTQLRALDDLDKLQQAVDRVTASTGAVPDSWRPVIAASGWPGVPIDPTGVPYVLSDGRVELSHSSALFPLPVAESGRLFR